MIIFDGTTGITTPGNTNTGTLSVTGAVTASSTVGVAGAVTMSATSYTQFPTGTTAQRPVSPATGAVRFNTSYGALEVYTGSAWKFWSTP
jgi:hypothetical protein